MMMKETLLRLVAGEMLRGFVLAGGISFVVLMLAVNASAQLPPLPVNDRDFPKSLAPVVEAEHAFAMYSIEHGMKDAFLSYAAPNGIVIRRRPVNAIEVWMQTNPAPTGLLTWYPIFADVSRAGDLGWTTGPWEFRDKPTDKEASGNGHFVTLWRKQADGVWKFELDFGISHAAPATKETVLQYPAMLRNESGGGKRDVSVEAARGSLLEAESTLAKNAATKGTARAFLAHADPSVRLYRQNNFPFVGIEAVGKYLGAKADAVVWHATSANVSRSGDLGYAYGTYESRAKASDEKPSETGNYMRIWRRQGGKWRVVLEVANPVPPPAQ
jgi:ketosteroid isomerase-like protein